MTPAYAFNLVLFVVLVVLTLYLTFQDRIRQPFFSSLLTAVGVFAAASWLCARLALFLPSTPMAHVVIFTSSILCGALIFGSVVPYRFCQSLFIIAIIKCYVDDISLLASVLYFAAAGTLPSSFSQLPIWPLAVSGVLTFPLILFFYRSLLRPVLDRTEDLAFWSYMWMIPLCSNLVYAVCVSPTFSPDALLPGQEFYFIPPLWITLSFATFALLLRMILEVTQNLHLQAQLHISELQVEAQAKQVEALQRNIEETSRARHDLRHHLLVTQDLLARRDYDKLEHYLDEYRRQMDASTMTFYSDNSILDALLRHYFEPARAEGIRTELSLRLEDSLPISPTDLCILLGNLLENALEACRRQTKGDRFFSVKAATNGPQILVLLVENSYEGSIQEKNGVFYSSKENGRKGVGLASVKQLVSTYHGVCSISYEGNIFQVNILLGKKGAAH